MRERYEMERFAKTAAEALNQALKQMLETSSLEASDLETPPDPEMGDFGFPCFKLSKDLRAAPPTIATRLATAIASQPEKLFGIEVRAVGPYVNFTVPPAIAIRALLKDILTSDYAAIPPKSRGRWALEFSSPNIAKPFLAGHLRSTAIGAALARIGAYRGFDVIRINHLGDWGTQYGKLAVAFELYGKELPDPPSINNLVDIYVKFHADAENDPALEDRAREAFRKLEAGDPQLRSFWKKCVDLSLAEFSKIYLRLGVEFDHNWGESHYEDRLAPLLNELRARKLLVESEGAWVVPVTDLAGREIPPCILQKQDGATIYATRDVAAAIARYERFTFDRMTYVVGAEQRLHFQQVFGVLRKMGFTWVDRCEHVSFGLYRLKDAKMSTRKGNFVTLEEILEQSKKRVRDLMVARAAAQTESDTPPLPTEEADRVAEAVAIGAVVYFDLSHDPVRDIDFSVDRVTDFEGETGPYLQYAHTRCQSILRKARDRGEITDELCFDPRLADLLKAPEEIRLVKTLGLFPLHLERALRFSKPSQLASYLIDITHAFNAFYHACRVLGEGPERTPPRLLLVLATKRVLARGLTLLGIPLPEKM